MSELRSSPSASIEADPGLIAKVVLMPGDPLRAKKVAETYLENPVCFNTVRNMLGFTGTYKGKKISVMGSGMGVPSACLGIEVTCLIRGLGEFPAIQQLLVEHAKAAEVISDTGAPGTTTPVAETPKEIVPTGEPTRDIADRTQMITASEVVEEGMTPITADKINDGVYSVKVKSSSSMFKITDAKLTVKDGKMNVEISMSGKSYIWMFMGPTDNIAAADKSEFIPAMKDANDVYSFTLPVNALDEGFFCAAYSKNKDQWYARTLLVRADSLPAGALK